jgi:hypothetical protein
MNDDERTERRATDLQPTCAHALRFNVDPVVDWFPLTSRSVYSRLTNMAVRRTAVCIRCPIPSSDFRAQVKTDFRRDSKSCASHIGSSLFGF